jgi:dolichol-phosphate mannosyltransferase
MLATLVYRFGPPGARRRTPPHRVQANGQCTITRRQALLDVGGFEPVAGHLTDDVALARHLARRGWNVRFADGTALLDVRMHETGLRGLAELGPVAAHGRRHATSLAGGRPRRAVAGPGAAAPPPARPTG